VSEKIMEEELVIAVTERMKAAHKGSLTVWFRELEKFLDDEDMPDMELDARCWDAADEYLRIYAIKLIRFIREKGR